MDEQYGEIQPRVVQSYPVIINNYIKVFLQLDIHLVKMIHNESYVFLDMQHENYIYSTLSDFHIGFFVLVRK